MDALWHLEIGKEEYQFATTQRPRLLRREMRAPINLLQVFAQLRRLRSDVADLKKGDKTEALIVRFECRDGAQRMWISPIIRPKTGGVALGDALEMGETAEGRFASLF